MKKIVISCLIMCLFIDEIHGQTKLGFDISLEYNNYFDVDFKIYSPKEQTVKKVNSQTSVDLSTPEGLIQSHFSASNKEWVKSNFSEPETDKDSREQRHFDFIKKLDRDKNYVRLIDKYSYKENGLEMALVLYLIEYNGEKFKFPTVLSTVKKNGHWYIYNLPNKMQLTMILLQIKPERFKELLVGVPTGNKLTDEVINKTRNAQKGLDINSLYELIQKWNSLEEEEKLKHFINQ